MTQAVVSGGSTPQSSPVPSSGALAATTVPGGSGTARDPGGAARHSLDALPYFAYSMPQNFIHA